LSRKFDCDIEFYVFISFRVTVMFFWCCVFRAACRRRLKHRVDSVVGESVALLPRSRMASSSAAPSSSSSQTRTYYSPCYYNMQSARSMPMMLYETRV